MHAAESIKSFCIIIAPSCKGDEGLKIEIIKGSCAKNYDGLKGCYRDFLNHDPYEISIKEIIERSSNVGTILATKDLDINYLEDWFYFYLLFLNLLLKVIWFIIFLN